MTTVDEADPAYTDEQRADNALLIAHAPEDLCRLLDHAEQDEREIASLRTYLDRATTTRRDMQNTIRGWQKHAERTAKILGCIAIDDTIEEAAASLRAELAEAKSEIQGVLDSIPNEYRIISRPSAGAENIYESLAISVAKMSAELSAAHQANEEVKEVIRSGINKR